MGKLCYLLLTALIVFCAYEVRRASQIDYVYPEIHYSIEELVKSLGYNFENHTITTQDGYILELHRLSGPKLKKWRPPILLMHGLACNSINWIASADKSLPVFLANEGFDVWLGNTRGNSYSRRHLEIDANVDPEKFFDFSWHEIGAIDIPAMIDYILEKTPFEKVYYAGHSQGNVIFHVMMSENPEYNEKVELMIGLAPVVYTNGVSSFIYRLPQTVQEYLQSVMTFIGKYELAPRRYLSEVIGNTYCRDGSWMQSLCYVPLAMFGGFTNAGLNSTLLPLMFTHFGAGASIKQLYHYVQVANANNLQKYDHGIEGNILKYGQVKPPLYYLKKTTVPVALIWSVNDFFIIERNIKRLSEELPNVVLNHKIPNENFNHIDYMFSFSAEEFLHPVIMNVINKHESKKRIILL